MCVLCCGMVWVSKGWGLGGVVLRKGSLSRGCVCMCVCADHTSVAASNRGSGVSCPKIKSPGSRSSWYSLHREPKDT